MAKATTTQNHQNIIRVRLRLRLRWFGNAVVKIHFSGPNNSKIARSEADLRFLICPLMVAELNSCPHSSSVIALTFRVDTPCTYISSIAATSAFSLR
jgi:hypothetical protein